MAGKIPWPCQLFSSYLPGEWAT